MTFRVLNVVFQDSGTYNDVFHRPYVSNMNGVVLDNIMDRVQRSRTGEVSDSTFAGIATEAVSPSAIPGGLIQIPQGWGERRIRFVISIEYVTNTGSIFVYHLQGFTDHNGIGATGSIDPNMLLYINSYIRVSRAYNYGPNGTTYSDVLSESAHIVNNNIVVDFDNGDLFTTRPLDLFTAMQSSHLENGYSYGDDQPVMFKDTRVLLTDSISSSRKNNNPSGFLSSIIKNYKSGLMLSDYGQNDVEVLDRCRDSANIVEGTIIENPFFRAMANLKGFGNGVTFSFHDLCMLDTDTAKVTNYLRVGTDRSLFNDAGQAAFWNTSTYDAQAATVLANAIPGILIECFMTSIYFKATNMDASNNSSFVIMAANALGDGNELFFLEKVKEKIITTVLMDISFSNQEKYAITMECNIYGDTVIDIVLGDNPSVRYVVPTFCDSVYVPIITNNKDSFNHLVDDFEGMLNSSTEFLTNPGY